MVSSRPGQEVTAGFDGGRLSSDGGVMLLAQAARRMRIAEKLAGDCLKFRVRGRVDHHAVTNLPSNMMANWVLASHHSRGGIFHSATTSRKTR